MSIATSLLSTISRRGTIGVLLGAAFAYAVGPARAQDQTSYTFLVLGIDTREDNTDQRSDVIKLARVDVEAQTVRTLSIPRDLWVEIPGHGSSKINAAYQIGLQESNVDWFAAASLTRDTITHNFGVEFDAFAVTDMNRFPGLVDAVGGVDVNNPYEFFDDVYFNLGFPAGELHLDGADALTFCRIRVPDGDGGRVMRQQLVLEGLLAKLQTPLIAPKVPSLVSSLRSNVRTSIPDATQSQLLALLPSLTQEKVTFTNIEDRLSAGTSSGGAWIYEADWSTLPGYVQGWLDGAVQ